MGKPHSANVAIRDADGQLIAHGTVPVDGNGQIDVGQFIRDADNAKAAAAKAGQDGQADGAAAAGSSSALDKLLGNASRAGG